MSERIHGDDLFGITPLRTGFEVYCWLGVCEVGTVLACMFFAGDGEGVVD